MTETPMTGVESNRKP